RPIQYSHQATNTDIRSVPTVGVRVQVKNSGTQRVAHRTNRRSTLLRPRFVGNVEDNSHMALARPAHAWRRTTNFRLRVVGHGRLPRPRGGLSAYWVRGPSLRPPPAASRFPRAAP